MSAIRVSGKIRYQNEINRCHGRRKDRKTNGKREFLDMEICNAGVVRERRIVGLCGRSNRGHVKRKKNG